MNATSEVLSLPVRSGAGPGRASSTNRVTAPGWSPMSVASTASRWCWAATGAQIAASSSPAATPEAAAAVDPVSTRSAAGRCSRSQFRHCASPCGWVPTLPTRSRVAPGRATSANVTGRKISRVITSGSPLVSSSSVDGTEPSTEFSSGTTAASASPLRTASIASGTVGSGISTPVAAAGRVRSAASANVPSGPR